MKFYELKRRKPSREKDALGAATGAGAPVSTEEMAGGGEGVDGGCVGMAGGGVGMDCGGEESASGRGLEAGSGGAGDGGDSEFDDGESGNVKHVFPSIYICCQVFFTVLNPSRYGRRRRLRKQEMKLII
jgi:hypothetical protein